MSCSPNALIHFPMMFMPAPSLRISFCQCSGEFSNPDWLCLLLKRFDAVTQLGDQGITVAQMRNCPVSALVAHWQILFVACAQNFQSVLRKQLVLIEFHSHPAST